MNKFVVLVLITFLAFLMACVGQAEPAKEEKVVAKSKVYQPSELVLLMREMEGHMKSMREQIQQQNGLDASMYNDYSGIFSVKASDHVDRDSVFFAFGNHFLTTYKTATEGSNEEAVVESYNNIVQTCVTCHRSYCPGPVSRINKLRLAE